MNNSPDFDPFALICSVDYGTAPINNSKTQQNQVKSSACGTPSAPCPLMPAMSLPSPQSPE
ncbi:hypothetical protein, partial [Rhodoferax sp. U11-2br]|uniref:hypothetical protein n=1 Tax=Rhodoferax sp. U11-2br TaxID=2838878 RepID=UPI001BEBD8C8